jgi:hypothetical protein
MSGERDARPRRRPQAGAEPEEDEDAQLDGEEDGEETEDGEEATPEGTTAARRDPATDFDPATVLPGGPGAPDLSRITVAVSRAEGPAPLGVVFQLRSSDRNFHNFLMFGSAEWRFSEDPGEDYVFRYLDADLMGERAGRAGGPYVGHVYVRPGRHRWSVSLHYPGLPSRTLDGPAALLEGGPPAAAITVHDPDRYFARRTVYFSNAYPTPAAFRAAAPQLGIPADLPIAHYRAGDGDFRAAVESVSGRQGLPWRLLIQAGRRYGLTAAMVNATLRNCFVDRFGQGHDPIITPATDSAGRTDVRGGAVFRFDDRNGTGPAGIAHLDIRGLYDSANPGTIEPWIALAGIRLTNSRNFGLQVFRCALTGLQAGVSAVIHSRGTIIADSRITSWFNFGFWHNRQDDTAIVGCDIKQKAGTVNTGRKSTAVANTGDRTTHKDPAPFLAAFDWALEWQDGRQGPQRRPNARAIAIPPGETPPRRGGWQTVSPWWKEHWRAFTWAGPNGAAFGNHDNGRYRNAAVHGPFRSAQPGFRVGIHQCEMRSLNGWSRSQAYVRGVPSELQPPEAYAFQPCLRIATGVKPEFVGHSISVHRVAMEGTVAVMPERGRIPTDDPRSLPLAIVISDCIVRGNSPANGLVGMAYGRCVLRNSLLHLPGEPASPRGVANPIRGHDRPVAPGSAPMHAFNLTVVITRVAPQGRLALGQNRPDRRPLVLRNILLLNHGRFANGDDFVEPAAFRGLGEGPVPGIGVPYAPLPGSNVLGGSDALAPHRDQAGRVRPVPAALGAFEAPG